MGVWRKLLILSPLLMAWVAQAEEPLPDRCKDVTNLSVTETLRNELQKAARKHWPDPKVNIALFKKPGAGGTLTLCAEAFPPTTPPPPDPSNPKKTTLEATSPEDIKPIQPLQPHSPRSGIVIQANEPALRERLESLFPLVEQVQDERRARYKIMGKVTSVSIGVAVEEMDVTAGVTDLGTNKTLARCALPDPKHRVSTKTSEQRTYDMNLVLVRFAKACTETLQRALPNP